MKEQNAGRNISTFIITASYLFQLSEIYKYLDMLQNFVEFTWSFTKDRNTKYSRWSRCMQINNPNRN